MGFSKFSKLGLAFLIILTNGYSARAESQVKLPRNGGIPGDILTPSCSEGSHNPRCWDVPTISRLSLQCGERATVYLVINQGDGPGCGESGLQRVISQVANTLTSTIDVVTTWVAPTVSKGTCHYYGPLTSSASILTKKGIWKVAVDGMDVGTYSYDEQNTRNSSTSNFESHCTVN